ncbi:hypothetical protein NST17_20050 [Caldifermentibacillus hisashii]|uniref:Uncharacterized protein n=1 Tax=Caldifermentibacillus hisashii TaxID=996558 RepID=A0ABU9K4Q9_9BACI
MKQFGLRKVKTWNGLKWGVVDLLSKDVFHTRSKDEKEVLLFRSSEIDVIEYTLDKKDYVALFPLTHEGYIQAKQLQVSLNKQ